MKASNTPVLLSGLVYPGIGQFFVKSYILGGLFSVGFSLLLYALIQQLITPCLLIADKILNSPSGIDLLALHEWLIIVEQHTDLAYIKLLSYSLAGVWLVNTLDAYRLGRQL